MVKTKDILNQVQGSTNRKLQSIFTTLHALHATRSSHKLSVCPYVCLSARLSNAWFVTKRKKLVPTFLYDMREHVS